MTSTFNGSRLVAVAAALAAVILLVPAASAYTIHQLGSLHYAIVCEDGTQSPYTPTWMARSPMHHCSARDMEALRAATTRTSM